MLSTGRLAMIMQTAPQQPITETLRLQLTGKRIDNVSPRDDCLQMWPKYQLLLASGSKEP